MVEHDPDRDGEKELPGFEGMAHLWPTFEGHRITRVNVSLSGAYDVTSDPALASALALGGLFEFTVQARLADKKFHLTDDKTKSGRQATGNAILRVLAIEPTEAMKARLRHLYPIEGTATEAPKRRSHRKTVVVDGNTGLVEDIQDERSELAKSMEVSGVSDDGEGE